jgi:hypothetical protein
MTRRKNGELFIRKKKMKFLKTLFFTLLIITFTSLCFAAGSIILEVQTVRKAAVWGDSVRMIVWEISSTNGTERMETTSTVDRVTGTIIGMEVIPDSTNKPDDAWDVIITDVATSDDVLEGAGTNLPDDENSSYSHRRVPVEPGNNRPIFLFNKSLGVTVNNFNTAGSAMATLILYLELP